MLFFLSVDPFPRINPLPTVGYAYPAPLTRTGIRLHLGNDSKACLGHITGLSHIPYLNMSDRATGWCVTGGCLDLAIVARISTP
ncbi:MAG: hypothetical protein ACFFC7_20005 [Candidatus Hermodarchaeota archaeon]